MKLFIKNMVSLRCKLLVKSELEKLGLRYTGIELGEVEIDQPVSEKKYQALQTALLNSGLELMDDKKAMLIEKIKNVIVEMVHYSDEPTLLHQNFSEFLEKKLDYDYTYLSNLFSTVKGTTIEQFIITHKIERAKELLMYGELNISEIAWKLHYSSVAYFSNQFKKVTGLTPSFFKKLKHKPLTALETI